MGLNFYLCLTLTRSWKYFFSSVCFNSQELDPPPLHHLHFKRRNDWQFFVYFCFFFFWILFYFKQKVILIANQQQWHRFMFPFSYDWSVVLMIERVPEIAIYFHTLWTCQQNTFILINENYLQFCNIFFLNLRVIIVISILSRIMHFFNLGLIV